VRNTFLGWRLKSLGQVSLLRAPTATVQRNCGAIGDSPSEATTDPRSVAAKTKQAGNLLFLHRPEVGVYEDKAG